ncbi:MAG TPA: hypothetical protein P5102_17440 [Candidatus Competibacteraceae bacterium]|nr:hypothetical protein [Candidatus Competibacteraceae bacterium]
MGRFIHAKLINAAADRLGKSRASKSFLHFLVFKRASALAHESIVSFSTSNLYLGTAVDDLTACALNGTHLPDVLRGKPHVNVFGSDGSAWRYLGERWRVNGTGPALSGAVWQGIINIVGERPRKGQISKDYARKLPSIMLKAGKQLPTLTDAAIWYHRADDLEARFGAVADTAQLED